MRRTVALTMCSGVLVAVTACGVPAQQHVAATQQAPRAATTSPSASPSRSRGKACPIFSQWKNKPAPSSTATPINTPQAEALAQALDKQEFGTYANIWGTVITDY